MTRHQIRARLQLRTDSMFSAMAMLDQLSAGADEVQPGSARAAHPNQQNPLNARHHRNLLTLGSSMGLSIPSIVRSISSHRTSVLGVAGTKTWRDSRSRAACHWTDGDATYFYAHMSEVQPSSESHTYLTYPSDQSSVWNHPQAISFSL